MKKLILFALTFSLPVTTLFAQKMEYAVFGYAGLSHYTGSYTSTVTFVRTDAYIDNPYGSKQTFTYLISFGGQAQAIFKEHFIAGLQLGIENVRSNVDIDHNEDYIDPNVNFNAKSTLHTQFVAFSPYIGYRLTAGKVKLDILPGADIAVKLKGRLESSSYTTDNPGVVASSDYKWSDIPVDVRARIGITTYYNRFGLSASYSRGLSNYVKNDTHAAGKETYTGLVRFGITYRIF